MFSYPTLFDPSSIFMIKEQILLTKSFLFLGLILSKILILNQSINAHGKLLNNGGK